MLMFQNHITSFGAQLCPFRLGAHVKFSLFAISLVDQVEGPTIFLLLLGAAHLGPVLLSLAIDPALPIDTLSGLQDRRQIKIRQCLHDVVFSPKSKAQIFDPMLVEHQFVGADLQPLLGIAVVSSDSLRLARPDKLEAPILPTHPPHDLAHVGQVHGGAHADMLE